MVKNLLEREQLEALPERIETSIGSPTINLNVAIPVITQINTAVQVAALTNSAQGLVQANLAGAGVGQAAG